MHDRTLPHDVSGKRYQHTWDAQGICKDDGEVLKRYFYPKGLISLFS
jgi:hypothetical protein